MTHKSVCVGLRGKGLELCVRKQLEKTKRGKKKTAFRFVFEPGLIRSWSWLEENMKIHF